jgi:hypothetical protein
MNRIGCIFLLLLIQGCATEVSEIAPCDVAVDTLQYYKDVYPIINQNCSLPACHTTGFEYGDFKDEEDIKEVAKNGKLEFMIVTRQMPPGITDGKKSLTDCEINTIRVWINNGASIE